ncbi:MULTISPECIES: HAD family hydrolase [unclassified Pseudomonas]|uniref:HAD family hydrolase n=1 Tax=unclassified Pseudomonas TaxID=196821 RepID=UPI002449DCFD|nr:MULTISPECIES: HAD family hydrolase [unclassified Pseudomonas]MDG9925609.1 HAD hydrolase-like protein [Pseudomonas sp. GD04045]MDH0035775.1 HAD hydrolase-like protein [Pseudomonas sp. GD04019]
MGPLEHYRTLVFDCDGVVLDSNRVKTEAFHAAALPYGKKAASELVAYHVAHGGISRYRKFEYLLRHILGRQESLEELQVLLQCYAGLVREGLLGCAVAPGLVELRERLPDCRWMIVSGGDQAELREIFAMRGLAELFDGGIFGSPDAKDLILERELRRESIRQPALFIGDSRFDHQCARQSGLDFVFLHGWSEFKSWREYCDAESIEARGRLLDLLS